MAIDQNVPADPFQFFETFQNSICSTKRPFIGTKLQKGVVLKALVRNLTYVVSKIGGEWRILLLLSTKRGRYCALFQMVQLTSKIPKNLHVSKE